MKPTQILLSAILVAAFTVGCHKSKGEDSLSSETRSCTSSSSFDGTTFTGTVTDSAGAVHNASSQEEFDRLRQELCAVQATAPAPTQSTGQSTQTSTQSTQTQSGSSSTQSGGQSVQCSATSERLNGKTRNTLTVNGTPQIYKSVDELSQAWTRNNCPGAFPNVTSPR